MRPKLFKDLEQSMIKPNPYDIQKNWLHHSESQVTCYHRCPFLQWKNEKWRVLYSYNYLERIISKPFFAFPHVAWSGKQHQSIFRKKKKEMLLDLLFYKEHEYISVMQVLKSQAAGNRQIATYSSSLKLC